MILSSIGIIDSSPGPFCITGGSICCYTESGFNYKAHTFTSTCSVSISGVPTTVDYLIVGGGGGGGYPGGGGAGGMITGSVSVNKGSYTLTVGSGGPGANGFATQGGNSCALGFCSTGGGGGGATNAAKQSSMDGGSGAGGGNLVFGCGTAGQGCNGGQGRWGPEYAGGGGGGKTQAGANRSFTLGGKGGDGAGSTFSTGVSINYAGGGGGGKEEVGSTTTAAGGAGGGGRGNAAGGNCACPGVINTGGGGGGAITIPGGCAGGSGIIVLRYKI